MNKASYIFSALLAGVCLYFIYGLSQMEGWRGTVGTILMWTCSITIACGVLFFVGLLATAIVQLNSRPSLRNIEKYMTRDEWNLCFFVGSLTPPNDPTRNSYEDQMRNGLMALYDDNFKFKFLNVNEDGSYEPIGYSDADHFPTSEIVENRFDIIGRLKETLSFLDTASLNSNSKEVYAKEFTLCLEGLEQEIIDLVTRKR